MRRACSSGRQAGLKCTACRTSHRGPRARMSSATAGRHVVLAAVDAARSSLRGDRGRLDLEEEHALGRARAPRGRPRAARAGSPGASRPRAAPAAAPRPAPSSAESRRTRRRRPGRPASRHSGWARSVSTVRACSSSSDVVVRERGPGELEADVRRRRDRACARVGRDEHEQLVEAELALRRAGERDVAVVRRVERAAEEPDHRSELELLVADLDLGAVASRRRRGARARAPRRAAACRRRGSRARCAAERQPRAFGCGR